MKSIHDSKHSIRGFLFCASKIGSRLLEFSLSFEKFLNEGTQAAAPEGSSKSIHSVGRPENSAIVALNQRKPVAAKLASNSGLAIAGDEWVSVFYKYLNKILASVGLTFNDELHARFSFKKSAEHVANLSRHLPASQVNSVGEVAA